MSMCRLRQYEGMQWSRNVGSSDGGSRSSGASGCCSGGGGGGGEQSSWQQQWQQWLMMGITFAVGATAQPSAQGV